MFPGALRTRTTPPAASPVAVPADPAPPAATLTRRAAPRVSTRADARGRAVPWAAWAKAAGLVVALAVGSFVLLHPDPYSLTAPTRWADANGLKGYPVHFGAYATLAVLAAVLRPRTGRRRTDSRLARLLDRAAWPAFLVLHGAGTELAQAFIPSRTCDAYDLLANACGVAAGWAAGSWWLRRRAGADVIPR